MSSAAKTCIALRFHTVQLSQMTQPPESSQSIATFVSEYYNGIVLLKLNCIRQGEQQVKENPKKGGFNPVHAKF